MRIVLVLFSLLAMTILASTVVDIEIREFTPIEPFLSLGDNFDERDFIQTTEIGSAQLVFTENDKEASLLLTDEIATQYVVATDEIDHRYLKHIQAYWADGVYGDGEVQLELNIQSPDSEILEIVDFVDYYLEEEGTTVISDTLFTSTAYEDVGNYHVILSARVHNFESDEIVIEQLEFPVIALHNELDEIPIDTVELLPVYGELEAGGIFLDWRSWRGGACELPIIDEQDTLNEQLDLACEALNVEDSEQIQDALLSALDLIKESWLSAMVHEQLGLIAVALGDWELAETHFEQAVDHWVVDSSALDTGFALHNHAIALAKMEQFEEATRRFEQAITLREQLNDEAGIVLSWAQIIIYWGDLPPLYDLLDTFYELDLPQALLLETYLDAIDRDD